MSLPIEPESEVVKDLITQPSLENIENNQVSPEDQEILMKELAGLLFGSEQKELSYLKERLNNPEVYSKELSKVLPKAISLSTQEEEGLGEALQATIETAIKISVKKDPSTLVEALFPVMGPAIRKSISQALSTMLQTLNQTLENSLSLQGLKWRWESIRTGRSFAEIVLLNTLLYRVEQVFFIHKGTGLLLQHLVSPTLLDKGAEIQDADMVSGMLSAIQDFVRDSFGIKNQSLDELQVGELTVWIEQGPQAFLAAVLRGNAPKELRLTLQESLEQIHLEYKNQLTNFQEQGDSSIFESVRPIIEPCLQTQYELKKEDKKISPALWVTVGVLSSIFLLWFSYWFWHYWHWQTYLEMIGNEPGFVITRVGTEKGKYFVAALHDPLAKDPEEIRKKSGLNPNKFVARWEPYQAIYPEFVLSRAKSILEPPETVTLKLQDSTLIASGIASHQWVIETRKWAKVVAGINSFKEENLLESEIKQLEEAKKVIEEQALLFLNDKTDLVVGQEENLEKIAKLLRDLIETANLLGKKVEIEIIGQSDSTGAEDRNLVLSRERADRVLSLLVARGVKSSYFISRGVGTAKALTNKIDSQQNNESDRRVLFRISLIESAK